MLLIVLVFAGGALTIVSPCILPVLPFVLSHDDRPLLRKGLPIPSAYAFTLADLGKG